MIKAVIFDLGGVVLHMKPLLKRTIEILKPRDEVQFWQDLNTLAIGWSKGQSDGPTFFRELARLAKKEEKKSVLQKLWVDDFQKNVSLDPEIAKLIRQLKNHYKLALLSNTNQTHDALVAKMGIYERFDEVLLSFKVGMSKDEPEIFRMMAAKLQVKVPQCVFIDDTKVFVRTANSIGMKAILYRNSQQLVKELKGLSVNIDE